MNLQTAHPAFLNRRQRPRYPGCPTRSHRTWMLSRDRNFDLSRCAGAGEDCRLFRCFSRYWIARWRWASRTWDNPGNRALTPRDCFHCL